MYVSGVRKDQWVGFDLDGTIAVVDHAVDYQGPLHPIGHPIKPMVDLIQKYLADGVEVRIMTARMTDDPAERLTCARHIREWCRLHIGTELEVTNAKDYGMKLLYDDRALGVVENTGEIKAFTAGDIG